ncbi:MAG: DUF4124 domain-containing protein [Herbaspirillum sp.]
MRCYSPSCYLLATVLAVISLSAQAAYKCEQQGHISYSDTPCPNGKTITTSITQPEPADSVRAQDQLNQQKTELKQLENARHRREAAQETQQRRVALAHNAKQKKCKSLELHKKWAEEDVRSANNKTAPKAQIKARRASEKHALECVD